MKPPVQLPLTHGPMAPVIRVETQVMYWVTSECREPGCWWRSATLKSDLLGEADAAVKYEHRLHMRAEHEQR